MRSEPESLLVELSVITHMLSILSICILREHELHKEKKEAR